MRSANGRVKGRAKGLLLAALLLLAPPGHAEAPLPVFDAHLHYNWEPRPHLPLEGVLRLFAENGVSGILANSRPNDGTRALVAARPEKVWVVPFLRPYRVRSDLETWFADPATLALIDEELPRAPWAGIGEFHLHGDDARQEVVARVVDLARRRGFLLHAHSDVAALEILFGHDPAARIIWAHTGFALPAAEVEAMLQRHPGLVAELSYRSGIVGGDGRLTAEWRRLFERYPERFLLGSDTWIDERWDRYGEIIAGYRRWLAQLPPEVARRIAIGNAERLFGRR